MMVMLTVTVTVTYDGRCCIREKNGESRLVCPLGLVYSLTPSCPPIPIQCKAISAVKAAGNPIKRERS